MIKLQDKLRHLKHGVKNQFSNIDKNVSKILKISIRT